MKSEPFLFYIIISFCIIFVITSLFISELRLYSLNTCNIKFHTLENAVCNYSNYTYNNMCNILKPYIKFKNMHYNILEIGAGRGISTKYFMNFLNKEIHNFSYTANEILVKYEDKLNSINNCKVIIGSFEDIPPQQYDIIFTTAFSAINDKNIHYLYNLCHKDTLILTLYKNKKKIEKYFKIMNYRKLGPIQKIYVIKMKDLNNY
jgi:hypothetical protein